MVQQEMVSIPPGPQAGASPDRVDDRALFSRHLAGDHEALLELFDRYNRRLQLYCLKMTGSEETARDIVQEVWERIVRMRSDGSPVPDRPLGLLLRMTRNRTLNHFRSRSRLTELDTLDEQALGVVSMREHSHLEELLVQALEKLPAGQREVLVLHAYSGFDYDEIAALLEKPAGAIHTTAWRARVRLGRLIAEMLGDDDDSEGYSITRTTRP